MAKTSKCAQFTSKQINAHHAKLTTRLAQVPVEKNAVVVEKNYKQMDGWAHVSPQQGVTVDFYLRRPEGLQAISAPRAPGSNHVSPIVELPVDPNTKMKAPGLKWWIGWRERWTPLKNRCFEFRDAGWSLYCSAGASEPALLVRAEWDPPARAEAPAAGQPHWHSHYEVVVSPDFEVESQNIDNAAAAVAVMQVFPESEAGELEPLSVGGFTLEELEVLTSPEANVANQLADDRRISKANLTGMHLAMAAGWQGGKLIPHTDWHLPLPGDRSFIDLLDNWCIETIMYIRSQLCYVKMQ